MLWAEQAGSNKGSKTTDFHDEGDRSPVTNRPGETGNQPNQQQEHRNMKSAYIISNQELIQILGAHLRKQGFNTTDMTLRFTSTNAVVAGITEIEAKSKTSEATYAFVEDYEDEEEDEEDEDWKERLHQAHAERDLWRSKTRDLLSESPLTMKQLAMALAVTETVATQVLCDLDAQAVCPAREEGETVSMFMLPGTEAYDNFVAQEKVRVAEQVAKWGPAVLAKAPPFYEAAEDRMKLLEEVCHGLNEEDSEELRRVCRNVFYGMKDQKQLFHNRNGWKAFRTEKDDMNLEMIRNAVREIEGADDLSVNEIAEKLPGFVDLGFLRHALGR